MIPDPESEPPAAPGQMVRPTALAVLLVDDCRLFREGLAALLAEHTDADVAVTDSLASLTSTLARASPEVVILNLASRESHAMLGSVRRLCPNAKLVVLGVDEEDEPEVIACAEAGVSGYITRSGSLTELLVLMDRLIAGEILISPRISALLMRRVRDVAEDRRHEHRVRSLTDREIQILRLIATGSSNQDIADHLSIQLYTVKNHVHSLLTKLGVRRRGEAAAVLTASADSVRGPRIYADGRQKMDLMIHLPLTEAR